MRAIVLIGGRGSRLRPLTDAVPKPLLPIGHRPMIERFVGQLALGGVDEVTLALGFRPTEFIEAFPDGRCGEVRLRYAVESEPLDTAGAIAFAARESGIDETFVVANGDVMTDLDVGALVRFHRQCAAQATIHLTPVEDPSAFGVVETEPDGRVMQFIEKPAPGATASNLINGGTYVFEPAVIDRIPPGRRVSVERETFQELVADGVLYALATDDYWTDTGRPELYLAANLTAIDRRRADAVGAVHPLAQVDASAQVEDTVIAKGAVVGEDARLRRSVILDGAHIDQRAEVTGSIVMGTVEADAVVIDSVIGRGATVPRGSRIDKVRIPDPT